jgi:uncharacterized lipoprotein
VNLLHLAKGPLDLQINTWWAAEVMINDFKFQLKQRSSFKSNDKSKMHYEWASCAHNSAQCSYRLVYLLMKLKIGYSDAFMIQGLHTTVVTIRCKYPAQEAV